MQKSHEFNSDEKQGFYKAIFNRRDVRTNFISMRIPDEILLKIIKAAHHGPSVGFSQPWNFILIRDINTRLKVKESFLKEYEKSVQMLDDNKERQDKYIKLKLEGILESDINICVTYDPSRFGPFVLGRTSIEETGIYSVCCAIENLWLAARVEGIGVGWVSILNNNDLAEVLKLPKEIKPIAYLSVGYVSSFSDRPDLEKKRWLNRMKLSQIICFEKWGSDQNEQWRNLSSLIEIEDTG